MFVRLIKYKQKKCLESFIDSMIRHIPRYRNLYTASKKTVNLTPREEEIRKKVLKAREQRKLAAKKKGKNKAKEAFNNLSRIQLASATGGLIPKNT